MDPRFVPYAYLLLVLLFCFGLYLCSRLAERAFWRHCSRLSDDDLIWIVWGESGFGDSPDWHIAHRALSDRNLPRHVIDSALDRARALHRPPEPPDEAPSESVSPPTP